MSDHQLGRIVCLWNQYAKSCCSEAEGLGPKARVKIEMPKNIYHRGFFANLGEALYPLSSRPCDGFVEARKVDGVALGFPPRQDAAATAGADDESDDPGEEEAEDHAKAE